MGVITQSGIGTEHRGQNLHKVLAFVPIVLEMFWCNW